VGDGDSDFGLTGDAERVAEHLAAYIEAGAGHFILDLQQWPAEDLGAYLETAEWFAAAVRPLVAPAGSAK
jgi:hypothetical protein